MIAKLWRTISTAATTIVVADRSAMSVVQKCSASSQTGTDPV